MLFLFSNEIMLKGKWISNVTFECGNATDVSSFLHRGENKNFTHIYSYNRMMGEVELAKISELLNNSEFKVLTWSKNPHETEKSGLMHCYFIGQVQMRTTGKEIFMTYVYAKVLPQVKKRVQ
jgi:hypothetical protein